MTLQTVCKTSEQVFGENFRLGVKSSLFGEMCIKCGVLTDSLLEILIYLWVPFCFVCCIDCLRITLVSCWLFLCHYKKKPAVNKPDGAQSTGTSKRPRANSSLKNVANKLVVLTLPAALMDGSHDAVTVSAFRHRICVIHSSLTRCGTLCCACKVLLMQDVTETELALLAVTSAGQVGAVLLAKLLTFANSTKPSFFNFLLCAVSDYATCYSENLWTRPSFSSKVFWIRT